MQCFECDGLARASHLHQAAPCMTPTAWTASASAFDECQDVGSIALHGAREVVTEKPTYTVRIAFGRIEESHPAVICPTPDRADANAFGRIAIQRSEFP